MRWPGGSGGNAGSSFGSGRGGRGGNGGNGGDIVVQAAGSGTVSLTGTTINFNAGSGTSGSGGGGAISGASGDGGFAGTVTIASNSGDVDVSMNLYGGLISGDLALAAGGTLWLNNDVSMNDGLTLIGGNIVADNHYAESYSNVLVIAGTLDLSNGAEIYSNSNLGIYAGTINLTNMSGLYASNDVVIGTGSMNMDYSTVQAYSGMTKIQAAGKITMENGSIIRAGTDVKLNLIGPNSLLTINSEAGGTPSYIWANSPDTIYLSFPMLASGGVVIDGSATLRTVAGGSGLFVGLDQTPAAPGAGLDLAYQPIVSDTGGLVNDLQRAMQTVEVDPEPVDLKLKGDQSTSDEGEFGDDEGKKSRPKGMRRASTCS